jgi:hypothetical protein
MISASRASARAREKEHCFQPPIPASASEGQRKIRKRRSTTILMQLREATFCPELHLPCDATDALARAVRAKVPTYVTARVLAHVA